MPDEFVFSQSYGQNQIVEELFQLEEYHRQ